MRPFSTHYGVLCKQKRNPRQPRAHFPRRRRVACLARTSNRSDRSFARTQRKGNASTGMLVSYMRVPCAGVSSESRHLKLEDQGIMLASIFIAAQSLPSPVSSSSSSAAPPTYSSSRGPPNTSANTRRLSSLDRAGRRSRAPSSSPEAALRSSSLRAPMPSRTCSLRRRRTGRAVRLGRRLRVGSSMALVIGVEL